MGARHFPAAAWLAMELWQEFHQAVALSVVPAADNALAVSVDGELVFQEQCRDGEFPSVSRPVKIKERVRGVVPVGERDDTPPFVRAAPWLAG